jgi:uncharacterized integral membrane protein (TIGR00697 family)
MSKNFKYLSIITSAYITFQLVSDVSAGKLISLFGETVSVTVLFFPVTYIFSDILTEVYGYATARRVLWTVMICSIMAGFIYTGVTSIPPSPFFGNNEAYNDVLGQVPRPLIGGWLAVFSGDIANNFVLAKLKILTRGKLLWTRTIASTIIGQFVNTAVFYMIGLYKIMPDNLLVRAIIAGWILKVLVEILFTPITYFVINRLKKMENIDHYDSNTNFNPFIIKE